MAVVVAWLGTMVALSFSAAVVALSLSRLIVHSPVFVSRRPCRRTVSLASYTWTLVFVNWALKPLSHSCPMDMRALFLRLGKRCACLAAALCCKADESAVW